MRQVMAVALFVTLGQRFGVRTAEPEDRIGSRVKGDTNGHSEA